MSDLMKKPVLTENQKNAGWASIVVALITMLGLWGPDMFAYLSQKADNNLVSLEISERIRREAIEDSLAMVEQKESFKATLKSMSDIYQLIDEMMVSVEGIDFINVFMIHDHGDVILSSKPVNVTLLYERTRSTDKSVQRYWQDEVLPEGYLNWCRKIFENQRYYSPDVKLEPDIYNRFAKEDMKARDIESMYGVYIGGNLAVRYFVTVGWNEPNPHLENERFKRQVWNYAIELRASLNLKRNER